MTVRVWTLEIPSPHKMLSANGNKPWQETSAAKREWRAAAHIWAQKARLPRGLDRVRVDIELHFTARRARRDAPNYHPYVCKPIVDALAASRRVRDSRQPSGWRIEPGYGLIPDDTEAHLDGPHPTIADEPADRRKYPLGLAIVTITDLSGGIDA
ncbi:MAG TPA: hypothetical protein VF062_01935 [Candidatus Limnocylindrales bacterium]